MVVTRTKKLGQILVTSGPVALNVHPTISDIVRVKKGPNEDAQPGLSVREVDTVGTVITARPSASPA